MALRGMVLIVGPDGTGKSTIADLLAAEAEEAGIVVTRAHFTPGIVVARCKRGVPVTDPHARAPRGVAGSLAKTLLVFADTLVGSLTTWRRARRRGLLLVERGWWDQAVDPRRYRVHPRVAPLVRALGRLLARGDLAVVLTGDPASVVARKPELSASELAAQLDRWHRVACRAARRVVAVDTTAAAAATCVARISAQRSGDRRWLRTITPGRVALAVTPGPAAPAALGIYRPSHLDARAGIAVSRRLAAAGALPRTRLPVEGLDELFAIVGDVRPDAVAVMRSPHPMRHVVGLASERRLTHIVKLGPSGDASLLREADTLGHLAGADAPFGVPEIVWAGEWPGGFALVTAAVPHRGRQPVVSVDTAERVATALTIGVGGSSLVHGDFASWNCLDSPGRLTLVDWESSCQGADPLFDLAHFVVQEATLLGRFDRRECVTLLTSPGSPGWRHLEAVGADPGDGAECVASYLARTSATDPRALQFRHELVESLS